jgi:hypothetical protein
MFVWIKVLFTSKIKYNLRPIELSSVSERWKEIVKNCEIEIEIILIDSKK